MGSRLLLNFSGTGTLAEVLPPFVFERGLVSDKGSVFQRDTKSSRVLCFSETTLIEIKLLICDVLGLSLRKASLHVAANCK